MARHRHDEDDAFDENGLLRDGRRIRVSLLMRDGRSDVQRAVAEDAASRRRFGLDDAALDLHQPGPCRLTDRAGLDAKARAYAEMCDDLQNAWRRPPAEPAADPIMEASDAWKTNNMSDREVARVFNTGDARADAWLDHKHDLENAWRGRR